MRRLNRYRHLRCFYCGRKTSKRYDGRTRQFDCPSCDATNYLDENGEIADPPVATDQEGIPARHFYAPVPRASSPPSGDPSDSNSIFCETCLKNQHMLSASLAQYLPDPDDPEYAEREAGLAQFRKNQERLYPQICADCEPKVRRRLEQAAYTAKTDVLRRMIDRSASARKSVGSQRWLRLLHSTGRRLWIGGFVLQFLWHAVIVHALVSAWFEWAGADDAWTTYQLSRMCAPLIGMLPSEERLLRWSTLSSVLGAWWNPQFAQVFKGTRHIGGLSVWYALQAVTVVARLCLQWASSLTTPDPLLLKEQTAGHTIAAGVTLLILILAPYSISTNLIPLFNPSSQPLTHLTPTSQTTPSRSESRPDEAKSLSELLDEIHHSPLPSATPPSPISTVPHSPTLSHSSLSSSPDDSHFPNSQPTMMGHVHRLASQTFTSSLQHLNSLHLSSPRLRPGTVGDEMDWSPTPEATTTPAPGSNVRGFTAAELGARSKYRAFNTIGQREAERFGAAPVSADQGKNGGGGRPFWYRVPPAPTTPAQRLYNPPNRPGTLRSSPLAVAGNSGGDGQVRFRGAEGTMVVREGGGSQVEFAGPRLFAEQVVKPILKSSGGGGRDDPRDGLLGMLDEGLSFDEDRQDLVEAKGREGGWLTRLVRG